MKKKGDPVTDIGDLRLSDSEIRRVLTPTAVHGLFSAMRESIRQPRPERDQAFIDQEGARNLNLLAAEFQKENAYFIQHGYFPWAKAKKSKKATGEPPRPDEVRKRVKALSFMTGEAVDSLMPARRPETTQERLEGRKGTEGAGGRRKARKGRSRAK